jgi:hypothetical protein
MVSQPCVRGSVKKLRERYINGREYGFQSVTGGTNNNTTPFDLGTSSILREWCD